MRAVSRTKKRRREQRAGDSMSELRPILFARCGGYCELCGCSITYETFAAHHRKFRSGGGKDEIVNLVALCQLDHDVVHAHASWAIPMGFKVPREMDPAQVPVTLRMSKVLLTPEGGYRRWEEK